MSVHCSAAHHNALLKKRGESRGEMKPRQVPDVCGEHQSNVYLKAGKAFVRRVCSFEHCGEALTRDTVSAAGLGANVCKSRFGRVTSRYFRKGPAFRSVQRPRWSLSVWPKSRVCRANMNGAWSQSVAGESVSAGTQRPNSCRGEFRHSPLQELRTNS